MSKTTEVVMSSKGQIVIPKVIRDGVGLREGSSVLIRSFDGAVLLLPKPKDPLKSMIALGQRFKLGDMKQEIIEHRKKETR